MNTKEEILVTRSEKDEVFAELNSGIKVEEFQIEEVMQLVS